MTANTLADMSDSNTESVINNKIIKEDERTCRTCHQKFLPSINTKESCIFHPEFYTGMFYLLQCLVASILLHFNEIVPTS